MKVNVISIILFVTGIIIIVGGFIMAYNHSNYSGSVNFSGEHAMVFDWFGFFMMMSNPLSYGLVLIGIGEVIRLMHKRFDQTVENQVIKQTGQAIPETNTEHESRAWTFSEEDEEKVYELYSDKAILEMLPSKKEGYCIVKLQDKEGPLDPHIKVVDVSGFGAREVHDEKIRQEILDEYAEGEYRK
ncbi:hypothetical protein [Virgibacillus kimchii]